MAYIRSGRSVSLRRGIQFLPGRLAYSTGSHEWSINSTILWSKSSKNRESGVDREDSGAQSPDGGATKLLPSNMAPSPLPETFAAAWSSE